MRSGTYGSGNPALPFTPGSDAAGIVESVGTDVELTQGDRVYTTGTITGAYAELVLCKRSQVHPLPARVSYDSRALGYLLRKVLSAMAARRTGSCVMIT
ncbi:MAG: alcohol dehydrogenase catalytic domain-containing protein [Acidobacteriia bacterium]|nr:alcohol dehydrogenase catalytic domain-containing protein [Terriglobia bacterium]